MLPRAISKLPGGSWALGRSLLTLNSSYRYFHRGISALTIPPRTERLESNGSWAGCGTYRNLTIIKIPTQRQSTTTSFTTAAGACGVKKRATLLRRRFSTEELAGDDPFFSHSPEGRGAATITGDGLIQQPQYPPGPPTGDNDVNVDLEDFPPAAAGLRPETAPASTPHNLGCKAYYMAKAIDIKTVCMVRSGYRPVGANAVTRL